MGIFHSHDWKRVSGKKYEFKVCDCGLVECRLKEGTVGEWFKVNTGVLDSEIHDRHTEFERRYVVVMCLEDFSLGYLELGELVTKEEAEDTVNSVYKQLVDDVEYIEFGNGYVSAVDVIAVFYRRI